MSDSILRTVHYTLRYEAFETPSKPATRQADTNVKPGGGDVESNSLANPQTRELVQSARQQMVIAWDQFDYTGVIPRQSLQDPALRVCAITGKLFVGHNMPAGGLQKSMYDPLFQLKTIDILSSPGNLEDEILHQSQRYWIAEAIRVTHRAAVHDVFTDELVGWPQFPRIDRLSPQKTTHYSLDPILESKGTASGLDAMCETMDKVFSEQLGYDPSGNFSETLHLLYGDEATVKKILDVQKKGRGSRLPHDKYDWVLPIPGPFLLRRKYMDMIHDVFSGPEDASCTSSLNHSQRLLGLEQGRKSPFRHKEEVAMQGFDARVTGLYYQLFLPPGVTDLDQQEHAQKVNDHIRRSGRAGFLDAVERIRDYIFPLYIPMSGQRDEFAAHALFLQQMEVYKTWKLAIKLADIGMIRRVIARVCLLMGGAYEYDMPSFYMAILACTAAADKDLQRAILANGLINLRGAEDSWFEVDRVNERFNIQMKDTLSKQHISSIDDVATLFREAALTSEHSRNPREPVEHH